DPPSSQPSEIRKLLAFPASNDRSNLLVPSYWECLMGNRFLNQSFTTGEVAAALLLPRQFLTDLLRRNGFEPESHTGGWQRLSFLDVVLIGVIERHSAFMNGKEAALLGNALRLEVNRIA